MARIYCIYDTVSEESGPLFEAKNDVMARRIYNNLQELPPGSVKDDFKLIKLGSYFHGNEKEGPKIYGLNKALDITRVSDAVNDALMEEDTHEAV